VCHLPLATPASGCNALGISLASVGADSAGTVVSTGNGGCVGTSCSSGTGTGSVAGTGGCKVGPDPQSLLFRKPRPLQCLIIICREGYC